MNGLPPSFARQRSLCVNTGNGRCKTCFATLKPNLKAQLHRLPCVLPHLLTWSQSLTRRSVKAKATNFDATVSHTSNQVSAPVLWHFGSLSCILQSRRKATADWSCRMTSIWSTRVYTKMMMECLVCSWLPVMA